MSQAVIVSIRNRRYLEAANLVVKNILKEKIHSLSIKKRDLITGKVAKIIEHKHEDLRSRYAGMNIKPMEIAEEVYNDIMLEFMPESTSHRPLSEQLGDEE